jgi:hypothetical protein
VAATEPCLAATTSQPRRNRGRSGRQPTRSLIEEIFLSTAFSRQCHQQWRDRAIWDAEEARGRLSIGAQVRPSVPTREHRRTSWRMLIHVTTYNCKTIKTKFLFLSHHQYIYRLLWVISTICHYLWFTFLFSVNTYSNIHEYIIRTSFLLQNINISFSNTKTLFKIHVHFLEMCQHLF